jgi:ketosteroid isomerase-like protein
MEKTFGPFMTGVYSETHQSGTVKSIRFIKPDVAAVDVTWEMTGAKNQDGTPRPTRKGLHSLVMTKQDDGTWEIAVMHVHEYTATPRITNPGQVTPAPAAH